MFATLEFMFKMFLLALWGFFAVAIGTSDVYAAGWLFLDTLYSMWAIIPVLLGLSLLTFNT
tara:strand:+ start:98 stop:280 length:183 start_codon:yes stop_codon:yes gene_type:complete